MNSQVSSLGISWKTREIPPNLLAQGFLEIYCYIPRKPRGVPRQVMDGGIPEELCKIPRNDVDGIAENVLKPEKGSRLGCSSKAQVNPTLLPLDILSLDVAQPCSLSTKSQPASPAGKQPQQSVPAPWGTATTGCCTVTVIREEQRAAAGLGGIHEIFAAFLLKNTGQGSGILINSHLGKESAELSERLLLLPILN